MEHAVVGTYVDALGASQVVDLELGIGAGSAANQRIHQSLHAIRSCNDHRTGVNDIAEHMSTIAEGGAFSGANAPDEVQSLATQRVDYACCSAIESSLLGSGEICPLEGSQISILVEKDIARACGFGIQQIPGIPLVAQLSIAVDQILDQFAAPVVAGETCVVGLVAGSGNGRLKRNGRCGGFPVCNAVEDGLERIDHVFRGVDTEEFATGVKRCVPELINVLRLVAGWLRPLNSAIQQAWVVASIGAATPGRVGYATSKTQAKSEGDQILPSGRVVTRVPILGGGVRVLVREERLQLIGYGGVCVCRPVQKGQISQRVAVITVHAVPVRCARGIGGAVGKGS